VFHADGPTKQRCAGYSPWVLRESELQAVAAVEADLSTC
jgi:hypothetical protein